MSKNPPPKPPVPALARSSSRTVTSATPQESERTAAQNRMVLTSKAGSGASSKKTRTIQMSANQQVVLIGLFMVFASGTALAATGTMDGVETEIFRSINGWPDGLCTVMVAVTDLSSPLGFLAVLGLVALARKYMLALQMVLATSVALVVTEAAKILIDRPRPFVLLYDIHQRIPETGPGFPSWHTALAAVLSVTLALALKGRWRWLAVLWITGVGLSRVYLGVHAPLDIIGGVCVGTGAAMLADITRPYWGEKARAFWLEMREKAR